MCLILASAELYDLAAGSWDVPEAMTTSRDYHTATVLPDGRVLIAGGEYNGDYIGKAGAELYDPTTGSWTAAHDMNSGRYGHTATLLPNGKVLVAGGSAYWNNRTQQCRVV